MNGPLKPGTSPDDPIRVTPPPPSAAELAARAAELERRAELIRKADEMRARERAEYEAEMERVDAEYRKYQQELAIADMLRLGKSLERQSKVRGALGYYRDIVDDFPSSPEAKDAARRIAALDPPPDFSRVKAFPVRSIIDGRTVLVEISGRERVVRLIGLDAFPPTRPPGPAKDRLGELIGGRDAFIAFEPNVGHDGPDGVTLAYLYRADDKLLVNREMVAGGYAVASKLAVYSRGEDFRNAEVRARSRNIGYWSR